MAKGFVYILVSPNSDYIKIGRTERPIGERLRGINGTEAYADHGPWQLSDFLHVTDCVHVEHEMHRHFLPQRVCDVPGTNELFSIPPHAARQRLRLVSSSLRVDNDKTNALFSERDISLYLFTLFEITGLFGNLDLQEAWTLSVMPKTSGGRWFTLNIGPHEVAFAPRRSMNAKYEHYLVMDRLILDYPETVMWVGKKDGNIRTAEYQSAVRAVTVNFQDSFPGAERFLQLPGVRRALVAYWADSLSDLRQREAKSVYARYHSYDAVAELIDYRRSWKNVFTTLPPEIPGTTISQSSPLSP